MTDDRVEELRTALADAGFADQPPIRAELFELLWERYAEADPGDPAELAEIRYQAEWTLAVMPADSTERLRAQWTLSFVYYELWNQTKTAGYLDQAIAAVRELITDDLTDYEDTLRLGQLLLDRYDQDDDHADDLPEAIRLLDEAVRLAPDDQQALADAEVCLGLALTRYEEIQPADQASVGSLVEPIDLLTRNLAHVALTSPLRPMVLYSLAELHTYRYHSEEFARSGQDGAELDKAIEYLHELDGMDAANPVVAERFARALYLRHRDRAEQVDLKHGIRLLIRSRRENGKDTFEGDQTEILGDLLVERARHSGKAEDIDAAVEFLEEAAQKAALGTPVTFALLRAYALRADLGVADLDKVIAMIDAVPDGDADDLRIAWRRTIRTLAVAQRAIATSDLAAMAELGTELLSRARHVSSLDGDLPMVFGIGVMLMTAGSLPPGTQLPCPRPYAMVERFGGRDATDLLDWLITHRAACPDPDEHTTAVALLRSYTVGDVDGRPESRAACRAAHDELTAADALLAADDPVRLIVRQRLGIHLVQLSPAEGQSSQGLDRAADLFEDLLETLPESYPAYSVTLTLFATAVVACELVSVDGARLASVTGMMLRAAEDVENTRSYRADCYKILAQLEAIRPKSADQAARTVAYCRRRVELVHPGAPDADEAMIYLAIALVERFTSVGDVQDIESAERILARLLSVVRRRDDAFDPTEVKGLLAHIMVLRAATISGVEVGDLDATIEALDKQYDAALAAAASNGLARISVLTIGGQLADFLAMRAMRRNTLDDLVRAGEVMSHLHDLVPEGTAMHRPIASRDAVFTALRAAILRDQSTLLGAVGRFEAVAAAHPGLLIPGELAFVKSIMWFVWNNVASDSEARFNALELFEQACADLPPDSVHLSMLGKFATDAYWQYGTLAEASRAVEVAFADLTRRSRAVLLQNSADHALTKATDAAEQSLLLTLRCLALGDHRRAVDAIELGRGVVLSAVATATNLEDLLRGEGHNDLADEWRHSSNGRTLDDADEDDLDLLDIAETMIPNDGPGELRRRVLEALARTPAAERLSARPGVPDIADALRAAGADVLMYLIPCQGEAYGRALLVYADQTSDEVVLPLLRDDDGVLRAFVDARARQSPDHRWWAEQVDWISRWAWDVAMAPIVKRLLARIGREPRVVVVACGGLGAVPWHAATRPDGRYLIQDLTVSYASTARQFCELAARERVAPEERPVLVAVPSGTLVGALAEIEYLAQCYPHGRFLGSMPDGLVAAGAGTPEEVYQATRFASVLHLSCHAVSGATTKTSLLHLAGGRSLTVEHILRQASGTRTLPGGLVVLAACHSDVTTAAHDEVLTLAAAFIAAGAAGVIGSRWAVDDAHSGLLMCLLHREMTQSGRSPVDALRAAQLWALDPDRVPPLGLPAGLAARATDPALSSPTAWAAFGYLGR